VKKFGLPVNAKAEKGYVYLSQFLSPKEYMIYAKRQNALKSLQKEVE
jgi:predicted Ser/Thr protein kinase